MEYVWDEDREDILFFGNLHDLEELNSILDNCLNSLKKSDNVRVMVLETWLALDFAIRQFLLSGYELSRFCDEGFDLKYSLLPRSFKTLLKIFQETIKYNLRLDIVTDIKKTTISDYRMKMPIGLAKHFFDKYPELIERVLEIEKEYIIEQHPELKNEDEQPIYLSVEPLAKQKRPVERMNPGWRDIANRFDSSWFKLALQLNNARNVVAHSTNIDRIGSCFGLRGHDLPKKIQRKCLSLMNVLLAVKTNDS